MQNIREITSHQFFPQKVHNLTGFYSTVLPPPMCILYPILFQRHSIAHLYLISIYTFLRLHTITTYVIESSRRNNLMIDLVKLNFTSF